MDLYVTGPNGRGGVTQPWTYPNGLKVEAAMTSTESNADLACPLAKPNFPLVTHEYNPKRHNLNEGVSKWLHVLEV